MNFQQIPAPAVQNADENVIRTSGEVLNGTPATAARKSNESETGTGDFF